MYMYKHTWVVVAPKRRALRLPLDDGQPGDQFQAPWGLIPTAPVVLAAVYDGVPLRGHIP